MTTIVVVFCSIPLALLGACTLYLAVLSVLALVGRPRRPGPAPRRMTFAVVVPAHDEESTIGATVQNLCAVDYPAARYDVIVVADNCTDETAAIAAAHGAIVMKRREETLRGKGHALRWAFDRLLAGDSRYEAVAVVDADTAVSPSFLDLVNRDLVAGADAVQGSDLVKPRPGAWSAEATRVGFLLYNYVRPLGRSVIGCSPGLRGNGMCFSAALLRRFPWQAYSRAEDLEYGLMLLLGGARIVFSPEATVLATMPSDPRNAESQRARWEHGRFPLIRKYSGRLLGEALRSRSFPLADACIDLVTPPLVNLLAAVVLMTLLTAALWAAGVQALGPLCVAWLFVLFAGFLHVALGLVAAGADRMLIRALLHIPRFVLWKILLYARLVRRGDTHEWVRTAREPLRPSHERDSA